MWFTPVAYILVLNYEVLRSVDKKSTYLGALFMKETYSKQGLDPFTFGHHIVDKQDDHGTDH